MVNIANSSETAVKQTAQVSIFVKRQTKVINSHRISGSLNSSSNSMEYSGCSSFETRTLDSLTNSVNKLIPLFNKVPTNSANHKNFVRSKKVTWVFIFIFLLNDNSFLGRLCLVGAKRAQRV